MDKKQISNSLKKNTQTRIYRFAKFNKIKNDNLTKFERTSKIVNSTKFIKFPELTIFYDSKKLTILSQNFES